MENKRKSIIIAVIITVLVFVAVISYCAIFIAVPMLRVIGFIALLTFSFAMILVLRERIKEIKKGETDDLSKY